MKFALKILFWQPKTNFYQYFASSAKGKVLLVCSNYITWIFLIYPSYLLVKTDPNTFWILLSATLIGEIVEKIMKLKNYWKRPAFLVDTDIPNGLIKSWYLTGSFPSGHTIKAMFFLLLLIQYHQLFPLFLAVIIPLLIFRVIIGFHYPIDILGGVIIGAIVWAIASQIQMPIYINQMIYNIFSFVFYYPLKIGI